MPPFPAAGQVPPANQWKSGQAAMWREVVEVGGCRLLIESNRDMTPNNQFFLVLQKVAMMILSAALSSSHSGNEKNRHFYPSDFFQLLQEWMMWHFRISGKGILT